MNAVESLSERRSNRNVHLLTGSVVITLLYAAAVFVVRLYLF